MTTSAHTARPGTEVLWLSDALGSAERCVIADDPGVASIEGTAVLAFHDAPASITYSVETGAGWSVASARVALNAGVDSRTIDIRRDPSGWLVDGAARPDLGECTSVDLGWSPATNTLPLRAAPLLVGESAPLRAAWLRFPELDVVASEQNYTRLAPDRVLYESATFSAELIVTDRAVVTTYGDRLWRAATVRRCD